MPTEQEILAALRAAFEHGQARLDTKQGQSFHLGLQKALSGHVEDASDYLKGTHFRFTRSIVPQEEGRFRSTLVVQLSPIGSLATFAFVQGFRDEQWWSQSIRSSRSGFTPDDSAILLRLRTWLEANGLEEADQWLLAVQAPDDLPVPPMRGGTRPTLYQVLFGR